MTEARFDTRHYPVEIRYTRDKKQLEIDWDDGRTMIYPAEFLRVESPSAEVQGHGPGQHVIVPGRMHVGIMEIVPVGNYAVRLKFDDLHDTGIYSWQYLREIGENHDRIWAEYLAKLEEKGLSRDPKAKRA
ncbi:MAG: DUF971 domain-containing protein [Alphaproteobacteria bacterium]|nr:DUF971 domain-containing protein [Alphaproteobacteria bacterium]